MKLPFSLSIASAAILALVAACGGSGQREAMTAGDGAVADSRMGDAGASDGSAVRDSAAATDSGPVGCTSFKFEASGTSCGANCGPLSCSCPGAFPRSLTKCTRDGCLVGGDCSAVCAGDFSTALGCTDQYSVRVRSDAGASDAGAKDAGVPLSANGTPCNADNACSSGRCATIGASGTCVAGAPGDACGEARDCLSAVCNSQICGSWTALRGGKLAKSSATLTELRALPDGYTVAGYGSAVDFGPGPLDSGRAIFLAEFADNGTLRSTVWTKVANTTGARGVRLPDGTRRLAGDFYTSWQSGSAQLASVYSGNFDLFTARYQSDGALQWSKGFGAPMSQTQRVEALAVDSAGATYLTGAGGAIDFGGGVLMRSPFLVKLKPDGALGWAKAFNMDSATGQGLAVDPVDGAVVWSGINSGLDNLSLDGTTKTLLPGLGIFLARFSADGAHVWSKGFESFGPSARVAVGPHGEIVMAGSFRTDTSFGGETFDDRGGEDVFIARFSPAGDHLWSRSFGGPSTDRALAIAIDEDGGVAVGGLFMNGADLGGGPIAVATQWDGFVARFSPTGDLLKLRLVQGPQVDEVRSLAFSAQGLLVGGIFSGTQDFGSGPVSGGESFVMLLPR